MSSKTGVLLINLGTPDAPTPQALERYLAEFLGDRHVVDYPRWLWNPILNRIILRKRPPRSAALYARIWEEDGSPLLTFTRSIADKLNRMDSGIHAVVGMRYGNPSIKGALAELAGMGLKELLIFPLFPQYTSSTSGTAIEHALEVINHGFEINQVTVIEDYHDHQAYILALADGIRRSWDESGKPEKLVFSFHSIPKRYVTKKGEPYQDQCYTTAALTAEELELQPEDYLVTFQSRFGPEPWLTPYTNESLAALGTNGAKSVAVLCPGFAADCLETLGEIAIEGREVYETAGGTGFGYIPALNNSEVHVKMLDEIIQQAISPR